MGNPCPTLATALVQSTIFPPNAIHPASFDACHMIYTQGQIIVQVEIIIVDRFLLLTINSVIQSSINLDASDDQQNGHHHRLDLSKPPRCVPSGESATFMRQITSKLMVAG